MGETPIEQSEFCHYSTRGVCGPLAFQVLEDLSISEGNGEENLCTCRFRQGKYICAPCKFTDKTFKACMYGPVSCKLPVSLF